MAQIHRTSLRLVDGAPGEVKHEQQAHGGNQRPGDLHWATRVYVGCVFLFRGARATKQQRAQQNELGNHAADGCGPKQNGGEIHAERCTPGSLDSTGGVRLQRNHTNADITVRLPRQFSASS